MEIKKGALPQQGNYKRGRTQSVKYIVIHYTANKNDTALNNINYFKNNTPVASAHYFVDSNEIYSSVPEEDTAYHCGASSYRHAYCRNANSIGIEMCTSFASGRYYIDDKTVKNTVWLTKELMKKYSVPAENVIRHYDVTGKICPAPMVNDETQWQSFKASIALGEEEEVNDMELQAALKELDALKARVAQLEEPDMIYNWVDENMPEWAREGVNYCVENGFIQGTGEGLGLDDKDLKYCTIIMRMHKQLAGDK